MAMTEEKWEKLAKEAAEQISEGPVLGVVQAAVDEIGALAKEELMRRHPGLTPEVEGEPAERPERPLRGAMLHAISSPELDAQVSGHLPEEDTRARDAAILESAED